MTFQINRADAVVLCNALGFKGAAKWDKQRMQRKLKELAQMVKDDSDSVSVEEDHKDAERLNGILADLAVCKEINVVQKADNGEATEKPAKPAKASKKPAKKAAAEEEEEEEEPEEDEEEEGTADPPPKPAKAKKGRRSKAKLEVGDWVHVADEEEEEEWDGKITEFSNDDYVMVEDFDGKTWEEHINVLTKLDEEPQRPTKKAKPAKREKSHKPKSKGTVERDRFTNRVGSQAADINAVLGKKAKTYDAICKETGYGLARVKSHVKFLVGKGFVKADGDKVSVV